MASTSGHLLHGPHGPVWWADGIQTGDGGHPRRRGPWAAQRAWGAGSRGQARSRGQAAGGPAAWRPRSPGSSSVEQLQLLPCLAELSHRWPPGWREWESPPQGAQEPPSPQAVLPAPNHCDESQGRCLPALKGLNCHPAASGRTIVQLNKGRTRSRKPEGPHSISSTVG